VLVQLKIKGQVTRLANPLNIPEGSCTNFTLRVYADVI